MLWDGSDRLIMSVWEGVSEAGAHAAASRPLSLCSCLRCCVGSIVAVVVVVVVVVVFVVVFSDTSCCGMLCCAAWGCRRLRQSRRWLVLKGLVLGRDG